MMSSLIISLYVIITSLALVVLKLGTKDGAPAEILSGRLIFNINPHMILGIVLYGISFILYMYLISKFDLGYIIPVAAAFVYILVFFASFVIFKESFTAYKIAGIALIVIGLALLNTGK